MRSSLLAATPLASALAWTVALIVDAGVLGGAPTLLVGVGLLASGTVASIGMIVVGGRWARGLGVTALALTVPLAVVREIDAIWVLATIATTLGVVAILSPTLSSTIRRLPSASGPPPRAVAPALILIVTPSVLGLTGHEATTWALLVVGLSAPVAAFLYSRVLPGGLLTIRLIWPLLAVGMAPLLGWVAGTAAVSLGTTVAVIAWHPSVKASYHPPREAGSTFPIPPELAPKEVLDAAEIDEKGRRR